MGLRAPFVLHRQSQVASDRSLKAGIVAQPRVVRRSADFWGALSPRLLPADQPKNAGLRFHEKAIECQDQIQSVPFIRSGAFQRSEDRVKLSASRMTSAW